MERRGPDAAGVWRHSSANGGHALLLHSRLSIIDLDHRSDQPLIKNGKVIIFNGELYNYQELRHDLEARGVIFQTAGDTEVLLETINFYGQDGLKKCEGMWAFALFDEEDASLFLCRDRFGEKPLYLYQDAGGFYFGSEIKLIKALSTNTFTIDYHHLYRFLVNGYTSLYKKRRCFYAELEELKPASTITIDRYGGRYTDQYWQPSFQPTEKMTYDEAIAGVRERLFNAVEIRLRADVPLAFCLSGGVDSNSLVAIARKILNYDVHGFTIVNTDARYEEQTMVEHAVAESGIRHTAIPVATKDFLPRLRTLIKYHDAPVATITYYAHWLLMESIARHGYKIAVSGTGADELFSGYYDHHLAYLHHLYQTNNTHYQTALANWTTHIQPLILNPLLRQPDLFLKDPGFRDYISPDSSQFADFLKTPWHEPFEEEIYSETLLRNRMANELFHENVPVILHEEDLNAMYYSVENRSPFLDRDLFDFCAKIPTRHLVRDGMAKAVLRDAMRGIVPEKIINNCRKTGFNAPIYSYLDVNDASVKEGLLNDSIIFDHVKRDGIEQLIGKSDLSNSESKFLFSFLSSKIFLEEFA